jgi:hypothetical protein
LRWIKATKNLIAASMIDLDQGMSLCRWLKLISSNLDRGNFE